MYIQNYEVKKTDANIDVDFNKMESTVRNILKKNEIKEPKITINVLIEYSE